MTDTPKRLTWGQARRLLGEAGYEPADASRGAELIESGVYPTLREVATFVLGTGSSPADLATGRNRAVTFESIHQAQLQADKLLNLTPDLALREQAPRRSAFGREAAPIAEAIRPARTPFGRDRVEKSAAPATPFGRTPAAAVRETTARPTLTPFGRPVSEQTR